MRRSAGRVTRPPASTRTRTTSRGGGPGTNEPVLPVAPRGGGDRRRGAVVRIAAQPHAPRVECAAPGRDGGCVPRLYPGVGLGVHRGHGVLGLRVSVLRVVRDGADAGDPRAADRHREATLAVSRLSAALAQVLPLRGARRPVRGRAGQVLGDARPVVHQPPVGPDETEPPGAVPRPRSGRRPRPRQVRRLHGRPALHRAARGERAGRRGGRRAGNAELLRERASVHGTWHLGRLQGPRRQPDQEAQVIRRQALVLLTLVGLLVATYLWLYKIGVLGQLQCGTGSCELVQASRYAELFGLPVALYGVAGYAALLGVGLAGLQPRFAADGRVAWLLATLATVVFTLTLYLTGIELFVLHAICRWCVASAAIMTTVWFLSIAELRGTPSGTAPTR